MTEADPRRHGRSVGPVVAIPGDAHAERLDAALPTTAIGVLPIELLGFAEVLPRNLLRAVQEVGPVGLVAVPAEVALQLRPARRGDTAVQPLVAGSASAVSVNAAKTTTPSFITPIHVLTR